MTNLSSIMLDRIVGVTSNSTSDSKSNNKIVNGFEAKITDFPFIVFVYIDLKVTGEACAGTLISENVVLTAAHCMYNEKQELFTTSDVFISAGSQFNIERNNNVYRAEKLVPHPKYNYRTAANDIGIIILKTNVETKQARIAQIYNQNVEDNLPAAAAGWGVTSNAVNAQISPVLMAVPLNVSSSDVCKELNPIWKENAKGSICTLNQKGQDTCYGDSGGPLVYTGSTIRPLIGVTSIGNAPGNPDRPPCGSEGGTAYYSNAFYYIDWISSSSGISKSVLLFNETAISTNAGNTPPRNQLSIHDKINLVLEGLARLYLAPKKKLDLNYDQTCSGNDSFQMQRSSSFFNCNSLLDNSHSRANYSNRSSRSKSVGSSLDLSILSDSAESSTNFEESTLKFHRLIGHVIASKKKAIIIYSICIYVLLSCFLNGFSYLWYVALDYTTISKVTVIYNTSSFFAYIFSVLLLNHALKLNKCIAVLLSIFGVFIMTYFDKKENPVAQTADPTKLGHTFGDILISICAVGTGLTQTLYGKYMNPPNFNSIIFTNFSTFSLGVATICFSWIPVVVLDMLNIEKFVVPNVYQIQFIMANALFGIIYNASFIILLSLTSPMFAAVGVMLTIPVSACIEVWFEGNSIAYPVFLGMVFVFTGFFYLVYIQYSKGSEDLV
ncbi:hypothetical protein BB561_004163 [Smittium simulii]|uniref:Peptidase S1 domain-containing protein n=1 Tax=Smittium simulii TaxID=133385 RepID=A0A2T9YHQ6_9FUNG|nr:hypothetical protein BB561_004163 [Smittium simulii]